MAVDADVRPRDRRRMIESTHLDALRDFVRRSDVRGPMHAAVTAALDALTRPIPLILDCPFCHSQHVDEGPKGSVPHRTHACQHCGRLWAPAVVPTVGVRFLPGCRNDEDVESPQSEDSRSRVVAAILRDHIHGCRVVTEYSWLPVRCAPGCPRDPISRPCPTCGAGPGAQCSSVNAPSCTAGDFGPDFHEARCRRSPLTRDEAVRLLHHQIVAAGQREREPPEWAVRAVLVASGVVEK